VKRRKVTFSVCSICLSVRRGRNWVDATDVIRQIRSYEFDAPPQLRPGICERCAEPILSRRAETQRRPAALPVRDQDRGRRAATARRSTVRANATTQPQFPHLPARATTWQGSAS
jgi:hypothetical protein